MTNGTKYVFRRCEKKYFVPVERLGELESRLSEYMLPDKFRQYTICSIYFDTENFSLIRSSIEKPVFKEKLRVRSYGVPQDGDTVFIELKKKYDGVVYKRREDMSQADARRFLSSPLEYARFQSTQTWKEISWFLHTCSPVPKAFMAYDRTALSGRDDPELRITFDRNIRWRDYDLDLSLGDSGKALLPTDAVLMEIKIAGAAPLWLARILSELKIFPVSFSKYGSCYKSDLCRSWEASTTGAAPAKYDHLKIGDKIYA